MKIIILAFALFLLTACSGMRRVIYTPDPGCAARALEKAGYGSHPRANFFQLGSTICIGDVDDRKVIYCPDTPYRWCK